MSVIILNEQNFETEVLKSDLLVLVDFWAEWCGPCKMTGPIIDELAKEYEGKMKVGKVNVDENQALAGKYNVMSIPTILIFKKGEAVKSMIGFQAKENFKKEMDLIIQ